MTQLVTIDILDNTEDVLCAVASIHKDAFVGQSSQTWTVKSFTDLLAMPGSLCLGGFVGDDLAGFMLVRAVLDEAEVITIAVLPAFQRKGIAFKLLSYAQITLKKAGVQRIYLEVREDNLVAIQAYKAFGFVKAGTRPAYYETETGQRLDASVFVFDTNSKDNN